MEMRFIADTPVADSSEDHLGFSSFIDSIATSLRYTNTPFVFGVLGDWGTGKTSSLQLLQKKLKESSKTFIPIWFNAWKYENESNVIYPLLYTIRKHYEAEKFPKEIKRRFLKSFLDVVGSSTLALTDLTLRGLSNYVAGEAITLKDITDHLANITKHSSDLDKALGSWADQVTMFENAFASLLQEYSSSIKVKYKLPEDKEVRFVIIIDDLDRCLPETSIAILEGIKNFLSVKHCIYLLGLNPNIIKEGIKAKYNNLDIDGRRYLEKILNYSFYTPHPHLDKVEEFSKKQLQRLLVSENDKEYYQTYFENFGVTLKECRFVNPRKIKRILNHFLLYLSVYRDSLDSYYDWLIIKMLILSEYYPDIFILYITHTEIPNTLEKIGTNELNLKTFEDVYGVSLYTRIHELSQMKALFKTPSGGAKKSIQNHALVVNSITAQ